jgi:hypothetical protein
MSDTLRYSVAPSHRRAELTSLALPRAVALRFPATQQVLLQLDEERQYGMTDAEYHERAAEARVLLARSEETTRRMEVPQ